MEKNPVAERRIHITSDDARRLEGLLHRSLRHSDRDMDYLRALRKELERARIVSPSETVPDMIMMRSCARLRDVKDDDLMTMTLVFPEDAVPEEGRVSVLAPLGAAVLGYRAGDTLWSRTPGGAWMLQVEQVLFQKEAVGQTSS